MERLFAGSGHGNELRSIADIIIRAADILLEGKRTLEAFAYKADRSIVTAVDHLCAEFLNRAIAERFPGDAILNEETHHLGLGRADWYKAERCWIIDPLDSTSSYVHGGQHYGILLGLVVDGEPALGMTYKPEKRDMCFAVRGEGAHTCSLEEGAPPQARRMRVSEGHELRLVLSRGRQSPDLSEMLHKLGHPHAFAMSGSLKINEVARGEYTAFISPASNPMSLWDLCATQIILEEAGGRMTTLKGHRLDFRSPDPVNREGLVASNGRLHQMILRRLGR